MIFPILIKKEKFFVTSILVCNTNYDLFLFCAMFVNVSEIDAVKHQNIRRAYIVFRVLGNKMLKQSAAGLD